MGIGIEESVRPHEAPRTRPRRPPPPPIRFAARCWSPGLLRCPCGHIASGPSACGATAGAAVGPGCGSIPSSIRRSASARARRRAFSRGAGIGFPEISLGRRAAAHPRRRGRAGRLAVRACRPRLWGPRRPPIPAPRGTVHTSGKKSSGARRCSPRVSRATAVATARRASRRLCGVARGPWGRWPRACARIGVSLRPRVGRCGTARRAAAVESVPQLAVSQLALVSVCVCSRLSRKESDSRRLWMVPRNEAAAGRSLALRVGPSVRSSAVSSGSIGARQSSIKKTSFRLTL